MRLKLRPFRPASRSVVDPFGDFALPTTLLVASGGLVLPLVFLSAPSLDDPYLLLGVLCHTLAILATFVVPMVMVHPAGERARHRLLDGLRDEYERLRDDLPAPGGDALPVDKKPPNVRR